MRESGGDKPSGKEGSGREEALAAAFFPPIGAHSIAPHTASHSQEGLTHYEVLPNKFSISAFPFFFSWPFLLIGYFFDHNLSLAVPASASYKCYLAHKIQNIRAR